MIQKCHENLLLILIFFILIVSTFEQKYYNQLQSPVLQVYLNITEVHLVYMTHLDMGYTNFARNICELYFYSHFPAAVKTAKILRERGGEERFIYTSHPWLILEYLDGAAQCTPLKRTSQQIQLLVDAINMGDVTWHAKPWNELCEACHSTIFAYGLTLSHKLDTMFNKTKKIAASSKDVVGVSRSVIPWLLQEGIKGLHIGANAVCTPPATPPVFMWRFKEGMELLTMLHSGFPSYGGSVIIPGFPVALVYNFTQDNLPPLQPDDVLQLWTSLRKQFPNAKIIASSLDAFVEKVLTIKHLLPVFTGEMGDTWLYGIGSDPFRLSAFREIARIVTEHLQSEKDVLQSASDAFLRRVMMIPEHNWGLSLITYVEPYHTPDGRSYYSQLWSNADFHAHRGDYPYRLLELGWEEHRSFLLNATALLRANDVRIVALRKRVEDALLNLRPVSPPVLLREFHNILPQTKLEQIFSTKFFLLSWDPQYGYINFLKDKLRNRIWANATKPMAKFFYQTFSMDDFNRFNEQYTPGCVPCGDFSKVGMNEANPQHRDWMPTLVTLLHKTSAEGYDIFLLQLKLSQEAVDNYGAPRQVYIKYTFDNKDPKFDIEVYWYMKTATRLAEAMWLSFNPIVASPYDWRIDVLGYAVSPYEVVINGSQHLHAFQKGVKNENYQRKETIEIESKDAALVAPGDTDHLLNFDGPTKPKCENGMHFNLYNNLWGTAFNQWYDEDARFRFTVHIN